MLIIVKIKGLGCVMNISGGKSISRKKKNFCENAMFQTSIIVNLIKDLGCLSHFFFHIKN